MWAGWQDSHIERSLDASRSWALRFSAMLPAAMKFGSMPKPADIRQSRTIRETCRKARCGRFSSRQVLRRKNSCAENEGHEHEACKDLFFAPLALLARGKEHHAKGAKDAMGQITMAGAVDCINILGDLCERKKQVSREERKERSGTGDVGWGCGLNKYSLRFGDPGERRIGIVSRNRRQTAARG